MTGLNTVKMSALAPEFQPAAMSGTRNQALPGSLVWVFLLAALSTSAVALELTAGVGLSSEYSSDVALQIVGEQPDVTHTVDLGVGIAHQEGAGNLAVNAGLRSLYYSRETFTDTQFLSLMVNGNWEAIKSRLDWQLQNRFSQQRINALDPDVPTNLQDINVFNFGPQITLWLNRKQRLLINPRFQRNYYEVSIADSQQYALTASWVNRLRKAMTLSLNTAFSDVRYDVVPADYQSTTVNLGVAGTWSRSEYDLRYGVTAVEREVGATQRGNTFSGNWIYSMSNTMTVSLNLASQYTEAGSAFLTSATTADDFSDTADQQVTAGAVRNTSAALSLAKRFRHLTVTARVQARQLDYTSAVVDRDINLASLNTAYRHTARLSSALAYRLTQTELLDGSRDDDVRSLIYTLQYRLSRTLNTTLRLRTSRRDSSDANSVYDESALMLSLRYAYR